MKKVLTLSLIGMLCCIIGLFMYLIQGGEASIQGQMTLTKPETLQESTEANTEEATEGTTKEPEAIVGEQGEKDEDVVEGDLDLDIAPLPVKPSTAQKRVVMYYPEWGIYGGHGNWMPQSIPWESITHMNYAFFTIQGASATIGSEVPTHHIKLFDKFAALEADAGTGEAWDSPYRGAIGAVRKAKKAHPQVKMMMSIGGWTQSANFVEVAATEANRKVFAESAIAMMRDYEFDGLDIDWEYPGVVREPDKNDNHNDQGNPRASEKDKENYTLLLKTLRKALDQAGKEDGTYYELSIAACAGVDKIEKTDVRGYEPYVDFVNLMTYDFHGAWEEVTGHQSQLYSRRDKANPYDQVVSEYSVHDAVKHMMQAGMPNEKIVIGIPYYTRGWKNVEPVEVVPGLPGLYAQVTPDGMGYRGARGMFDGGVPAGNNPYYYVVEQLEKDPAFTKYWDPISQVPYLYSSSKKEFYTYDDPQSIQIKMDYINKNHLGGAIIWEATCERPGNPVLTQLIYKELIQKP